MGFDGRRSFGVSQASKVLSGNLSSRFFDFEPESIDLFQKVLHCDLLINDIAQTASFDALTPIMQQNG